MAHHHQSIHTCHGLSKGLQTVQWTLHIIRTCLIFTCRTRTVSAQARTTSTTSLLLLLLSHLKRNTLLCGSASRRSPTTWHAHAQP